MYEKKGALSIILICSMVLSIVLFQCIPLSAQQVDSYNVSTASSSAPSINIVFPNGRTFYGSSYPIKVPVSAEVLNMNNIKKVEFYYMFGECYTSKYGEVTESPYNFTYEINQAFPDLPSNIYVKAIGTDGSVVTSEIVQIYIYYCTPTPTLTSTSTIQPTVTPVPSKVPSIRIISPENGEVFDSFDRPIKVPISAEVLNVDNVEKVEFYSDYSGKIGEVTESPYNLTYNADISGHYMPISIYVKADLKDGSGITSSPVKVLITVPTPTPHSQTSTPTPTSTSTNTPENTPVPTNPSQEPTPSPYISGRVVPDNSGLPVSGIKVEAEGTDLSYTTTSYQAGYFMFIDQSKISLPHTLKISKEGYLSREFTVEQPMYFYDNITLWPGDINNDNSINMEDVMILAKSFNTKEGDSGFNSICDFNLDKVINMADVMILAKHFNKTPADYDKQSSTIIQTSTPVSPKVINLKVDETKDITCYEGGIIGISWSCNIEDESIIALYDESWGSARFPDDMYPHVWRFRAIAQGTTKITFNSLTRKDEYIVNVS